MRLPWRKKQEKATVTAKTPLGQIRQLYSHYQKQSNMWGYTLLSSMVLILFWVLFSAMRFVDWTYLSLPLMGILFSLWQMKRIKSISSILRNAHEVQQQIEKAEAEKKVREEKEAAKNGRKPKATERNGTEEASGGTEKQGAEKED